MIKRLIFDVDGTLITGISFSKAILTTLNKMNIYTDDCVKLFFDAISSYEEKYNNYNKEDYLKHFSRILGVELNDDFLKVFFEELKKCIPLKNEKLSKTIKSLANKYELVLLTNYFKESQLNRLNNMGIGHFFIDCYGEELIKPNNESYLKACGPHMPSVCVMIGDDLYLDIMKSKEMGLNAIFVNSKNIEYNDFNICTVSSVEEICPEVIESIVK